MNSTDTDARAIQAEDSLVNAVFASATAGAAASADGFSIVDKHLPLPPRPPGFD